MSDRVSTFPRAPDTLLLAGCITHDLYDVRDSVRCGTVHPLAVRFDDVYYLLLFVRTAHQALSTLCLAGGLATRRDPLQVPVSLAKPFLCLV